MRVLLLSTVLYLAGIAVLLYVRPPLIFHADGRWKEFGLGGGEDVTVFPLWMFCILWAFVSYFISRTFFAEGAFNALQATTSAAAAITSLTTRVTPMSRRNVVDDEDSGPAPGPSPQNLVEPLPVEGPTGGQAGGRGRGRRGARLPPKMPKGYYVYVGGSDDEEDAPPA